MSLNRRDFASLLVMGPLALLGCRYGLSQSEWEHGTPSKTKPVGGGKDILLVTYPGMTALDLIGPLNGLVGLSTEGYRCHLVGRNFAPVPTDTAFGITPTLTFDDAPKEAQVILFPGGTKGTVTAMEDPNILKWLKERAPKTKYITSVCTGALILGAAGLLKGKQAVTHWVVQDQLSLFGAKPSKKRYVIDGNIGTSAGVSAGIDLGLELSRRIGGLALAQTIQLLMEYAPTPPFQAGTPESAPKAAVERIQKFYAPFRNAVQQIAGKQKP